MNPDEDPENKPGRHFSTLDWAENFLAVSQENIFVFSRPFNLGQANEENQKMIVLSFPTHFSHLEIKQED